jgi:hypothetical protein
MSEPALSEVSVAARLQLHWAGQLLTAAADAVHGSTADDSHSNLGWDGSRGALMGRAHAGLRFVDLSIVFDDRDDELALAGRTLDEARAWLAPRVGAQSLSLRDYDMPAHPVSGGATFDTIDAIEYDAVAQWYAVADELFTDIRTGHAAASEVRCWPHHFDIATLITIEAADDPHDAKSIGVGMSPGDNSYDQPYWYVNPWPRPAESGELPTLAAGAKWHTDGWFGAVLTQPTPTDDVQAFLVSALAHARTFLLGD